MRCIPCEKAGYTVRNVLSLLTERNALSFRCDAAGNAHFLLGAVIKTVSRTPSKLTVYGWVYGFIG